MQPFKVYILGCGSALPTLKHSASSQIVELRDKQFMIDCGEGTQIQLRKLRIPFTRMQAVFISHLHGDHCFGLMGMLSSFGMLGRKSPLHIYAPKAYGDLFTMQTEMFCPGLGYDVVFHPLDTTVHQVIYEDKSLTVTTLPLEHRVPCCGFLFKEKPTLPHIRREMIDFLDIPISQVNNIKNGNGWTTPEGRHYAHEDLVMPADPARSYAYCSDTRYMPHLYERIMDVNLLYHESTYCNDKADNARLYYHSTAEQAATVAKASNAEKLILGHYSARYNDEQQLLKEARTVFAETYLSNEGDVFEVR